MGRSRPNLIMLLSLGLALLVVADIVRRAAGPRTITIPAARDSTVTTQAAYAAPDSATVRAARWAAVRERIEREGEGTYLVPMLDGDSMLRRWPDERLGRPVRVAVVPGGLGYREEFAGTVAWALARWNGALPVRLEAGADSVSAHIVVVWVDRLEAGRTGTTEIAWDGGGRISRARITLGTHTPEGEALGIRQMTALVLHELGHAIGLNHSPDSLDALYPRTRAIELTERDRRTGRLLYALPPGRFR
jgi:hypothetical protein